MAINTQSPAKAPTLPRLLLAADSIPLRRTIRPGTWLLVGVIWFYVVGVATWLLAHRQHPETTWWISNWAATPPQMCALMLVAVILGRGDVDSPRRRAWWWLAGFIALSIFANFVWNDGWSNPRKPQLTLGDALYLLSYVMMIIALGYFYIAAGGSLGRPQFWRDAVTTTVAFLATVWSFLFAPYLQNGLQALAIQTMVAYAMTLTVMMSMGVLLVTQTMGLRGHWVPIMLFAAAIAEVAWEIAWLAGQINGRSYVGLFYNIGDVLCFSLLATAAAVGRYSEHTVASDRSLESSAYGFLPALSVLIAVALVAASTVTVISTDAWVRAVLVLLGGLLLVTRQRGVRAEIQALNHALLVRDSYARLTELARHSADLIVVVSDTLHLTFVSPAAESILGVPPAQLMNAPAILLLGRAYEAELAVFLHSLLADATSNSEMEAIISTPGGGSRELAVSASNQLANRLIAGVILTLRDITIRRALEREVIAVAAHERMRLSSDIHEGLGQELSGIALLLHSAATHPILDLNAQRECLEAIVAHVNRTIEMARNLAEELSPVHVARDSLETALRRLVQGLRERDSINVEMESSLNDQPLDPDIADHLFRITNEAINNALRHSGCTDLRIGLNRLNQTLFLTITDNGRGMGPTAQRRAGLGLRMMHYRARMIGGILRLESADAGGTRLAITVPLRG